MAHRDVVAIIPARLPSKRLPRKPLANLAGRPLIEHVWRRVRRCKFLHGVFVATDSEEIAEVVTGFGGVPIMTSSKHPSGTDRVAEALEEIGAWGAINVQGDEPFISPTALDKVAQALIESNGREVFTLASTGSDTKRLKSPHVVKVAMSDDGRALYFSRSPVPYSSDGTATFYEHIGIYGYSRRLLNQFVAWKPSTLERTERLEQLRYLEHGIAIRVIKTRHSGFGIDTPADLRRAAARLTGGRRNGKK